MELGSYLELLGIDFQLDPLTGLEVGYGEVTTVKVDPLGSTDVDVSNGLVDVGIDSSQGVLIDIPGIVTVDSSEVAIDIVDLVDVGVDSSEVAIDITGLPDIEIPLAIEAVDLLDLI